MSNPLVQFIVTGPLEIFNGCKICREPYQTGKYLCAVVIGEDRVHGLGYVPEEQPSHCNEKKEAALAIFDDFEKISLYVKRFEKAYKDTPVGKDLAHVIPLVTLPIDIIDEVFEIMRSSTPRIPLA